MNFDEFRKLEIIKNNLKDKMFKLDDQKSKLQSTVNNIKKRNLISIISFNIISMLIAIGMTSLNLPITIIVLYAIAFSVSGTSVIASHNQDKINKNLKSISDTNTKIVKISDQIDEINGQFSLKNDLPKSFDRKINFEEELTSLEKLKISDYDLLQENPKVLKKRLQNNFYNLK